MSDIGLPKGMTRDEAYVAGVADGEKSKRQVIVTRVPVEQGGSFTPTPARAKLARAQAELNKIAYDLRHGVLKADPIRFTNGVQINGTAVQDALHGLDVIQQALDELGGVL